MSQIVLLYLGQLIGEAWVFVHAAKSIADGLRHSFELSFVDAVWCFADDYHIRSGPGAGHYRPRNTDTGREASRFSFGIRHREGIHAGLVNRTIPPTDTHGKLGPIIKLWAHTLPMHICRHNVLFSLAARYTARGLQCLENSLRMQL